MRVFIERTPIEEVLLLVPEVFEDERGFFMEAFREDIYREAGLPLSILQVNHSGSVRDVVRGLHFQWDPPMAKLMRVLQGRAFLVAVDIRKGSPTLGRWFGLEVDARQRRFLWAPAGFARGFCVLSDYAEIEYLCTGTYNGGAESGILWNDPELGIAWPVRDPILSERDGNAQTLAQWLARPEAEHFRY
ncbi:MAG: dTDP-4-dehydrorhamnose 3,5-epimerase [Gemmatimonadetes bacterium]|nr:dTDP-4-dehydrorhamnose 3,5-epimerase [Gemmatimonadota bacterium]